MGRIGVGVALGLLALAGSAGDARALEPAETTAELAEGCAVDLAALPDRATRQGLKAWMSALLSLGRCLGYVEASHAQMMSLRIRLKSAGVCVPDSLQVGGAVGALVSWVERHPSDAAEAPPEDGFKYAILDAYPCPSE